MPLVEKTEIIDRLTSLSERAVAGTPVEIVDVQLRGAGKARLLRVYIDKPGGVTHGDCQLVSENVGKLLDEDETLLSEGYTLEVSSPGVDRKLSKPRDFERVLGQKVKLTVGAPIAGQTHLEGKLEAFTGGVLAIQTSAGVALQVPFEQVQKANLKFEW